MEPKIDRQAVQASLRELERLTGRPKTSEQSEMQEGMARNWVEGGCVRKLYTNESYHTLRGLGRLVAAGKITVTLNE